MEKVTILGSACELDVSGDELRIEIDFRRTGDKGRDLLRKAFLLEGPNCRLFTFLCFSARESAGEIRLKQTFYSNGGMIHVPWKEWEVNRVVEWLNVFLEEGLVSLPDWCKEDNGVG